MSEERNIINGKYVPDLEHLTSNPIWKLATLRARLHEMIRERQEMENKAQSLASKEMYIESKIKFLEQEYDGLHWVTRKVKEAPEKREILGEEVV